MVKASLSAFLGLVLLAQPCLSAVTFTADVATSQTAQTLAELPGRPADIAYVPNQPIEDFFAVTLISLPFTAFWGLLGALIVGGINQNRFPPEFTTPLLAGAGLSAAGASVATGLISIQWGPAKAPGRAPTPTPTPQP